VTTDDLVKRLTIKASVMEMGEKIAWGSDTSLMREAADRIEELEAKLAKSIGALEKVKAFVRDLEPSADHGHTLVPALREACETLAELKGKTDA